MGGSCRDGLGTGMGVGGRVDPTEVGNSEVIETELALGELGGTDIESWECVDMGVDTSLEKYFKNSSEWTLVKFFISSST